MSDHELERSITSLSLCFDYSIHLFHRHVKLFRPVGAVHHNCVLHRVFHDGIPDLHVIVALALGKAHCPTPCVVHEVLVVLLNLKPHPFQGHCPMEDILHVISLFYYSRRLPEDRYKIFIVEIHIYSFLP